MKFKRLVIHVVGDSFEYSNGEMLQKDDHQIVFRHGQEPCTEWTCVFLLSNIIGYSVVWA